MIDKNEFDAAKEELVRSLERYVRALDNVSFDNVNQLDVQSKMLDVYIHVTNAGTNFRGLMLKIRAEKLRQLGFSK